MIRSDGKNCGSLIDGDDWIVTMQADAPTVHKKERQAEAARDKICKAVIRCLDRYGYADTSIARVQEAAGVSRGALTHHFPTKQALVTATADRLLQTALRVGRRRTGPPDDNPAPTVEAYLTDTWDKVVNTPEGRALIEILIATRTDTKLHRDLADRLVYWDGRLSKSILEVFASPTGDDDDVMLIWSICRTFIRGLLIQERFSEDPQALQRAMKRFATIVSPHLRLRD